MTKALLLGAGLVARPLIRYLLDQPDFHLTVVDRIASKAAALIDGHPNGTALALSADDRDKLAELIREHDVAISLLPAPLHPVVAKLCIQYRKHMVAPSYVSPAMKALDGVAREAGVMILNEIGVDPGIDHMSAMRVIDDVRSRGGEVVSFKSYCGGIPAPECNDNPFGYKFSWSPRAVCSAGKSRARFLEDGRHVDVPGPELFACTHRVHVDTVGELEVYPNRDSLSYIDVYGLKRIETMYRGTFRYIGWCDTLKAIADMGLLDETRVTYPAGTTYGKYTAGCLGTDATGSARSAAAAKLELEGTSPVLDRLEWLGLFGDETIAITDRETTALDILSARMEQKMNYKPGERDMIVLCHYFLARFPSAPDERITSTLIDYGQPNGDSSMARTVSLPAAIATKLILSGSIMVPGVHIPVAKEIYNPVLDELARLDIRCIEKTETSAS